MAVRLFQSSFVSKPRRDFQPLHPVCNIKFIFQCIEPRMILCKVQRLSSGKQFEEKSIRRSMYDCMNSIKIHLKIHIIQLICFDFRY